MSREMKNSGVPWIGDIPNYWSAVRIKDLADNSKNDSFTDGDWIESQYITDNGIRYYTSGNVGDGAFKPQGNGYISEETFAALKCKYAYPGDLVIARLNAPFGRSCILPSESDKYVLAVDIAILRTAYCKEYLNYAMQCQRYHHAVEEQASGTAMQRISRSNLGKIKLPIPPMAEQKSIVHYLDSHCSTIDSAISKHQQIIEKLEEYRKAVITQTVTKGLNPNVEMKDSGDSIIPIVPSHWLWTRVKFTVNVVRGGSPRPIEQYIIGEKEDGYNWIKIGDATGGGKFIIATKQRIKPDGLNKTRLVHAGTLLLTNSMSFGHPYFLQIDGCIHDGWLAFSDYKGVLPAFLYYYLMSETTAHQFTTTADGSVVQNLNIDKVRNSHIALPPIVEQKAIVQYLDTVDGKINTAIQHHNQIIEKLQEYKQSLIYNAVTGKIDCTTEASI